MLPEVTRNLIIINVIIWLAGALIPVIGANLERFGALYYFTSDEFLPFQLLSYMFIHASFMHLFFNMFALYMFGGMMERVLGPAKFLLYYISCGLGAALVQEGVFALMIAHYASAFPDPGVIRDVVSHSFNNSFELQTALYQAGVSFFSPDIITLYGLYHTPTVGASGAIYGILLAFGFMFPNARIYLLFPPIPLKAKWLVIGYAVLELALGVYNSHADTVAHFAHLGGMLVGLGVLLYWRKKHIIGGPYY